MADEDARKAETRVREYRCEKDAAAVAEILRESKEAADWPEEDLRNLDSLSGVRAYVSERGKAVSGVAVGRRILDEAEVLNLAVRREFRRRGEGRQLVRRLLKEFRINGVSRVFLEVRESNAGAIAFYKELGFRAISQRRDYYQDPLESAIVMEIWLRQSTDSAKLD